MLSCQNLTVQAGTDGPVILDSANARFLPRGLNAVIGPSGCGKTTLMKAILGILPSTGEASLAGQPISCTEDLVGKVGFAPQFTAASTTPCGWPFRLRPSVTAGSSPSSG